MRRLLMMLIAVFFSCLLLQGMDPDELLREAEAKLTTDPRGALETALKVLVSTDSSDMKLTSARAGRIAGNASYRLRLYEDADSLWQIASLLAEEAGDSDLQSDLLYNLGLLSGRWGRLERAIGYHQKALELRKKTQDRADCSRSANALGNIWWQMGNMEQSVSIYRQAVGFAVQAGDSVLTSRSLQNLGNAYFKHGDYTPALQAYLRGLRIREAMGDSLEISNALLSLGNFHLQRDSFDEAREYYLRALAIYRKSGDSLRVADVSSNLGVACNGMGEYTSASKAHLRALRIYRTLDQTDGVARALNNLGNIARRQDDLVSAKDYYDQSLQIKRSTGSGASLALTCFNLAGVVLALGDREGALKLAEESLRLSRKYGLREDERNALSLLSDIETELGDYKSALSFYREYTGLVDSLYNWRGMERIEEMRIRYETEKKDQQILLLEKDRELKRLELEKTRRERLLYISLAAGGALLLLVFGGMYGFARSELRRRRQAEHRLMELNHTLEERITAALSEQRRQQQMLVQRSKLESLGRLAAGIAHEINQPLSGISMGLDNILARTSEDRCDVSYIREKCNLLFEDIERIRQIIEHVRVFSRDQKNIVMDRVDVSQVARSSLSMMQTQLTNHHIRLETSFDTGNRFTIGNPYKLEQVVLNLLANARDALENVKSDDKRIRIRTSSDTERIRLIVEDNGEGIPRDMVDSIFDPFFTTKAPDRGTGLGLSICFGIVNEMDGEITVESEQEAYTRFTISLPVYGAGKANEE